ncbi:MAG: DUF4388 domain-containing protein [Acidobacteriia bacterium]|nr:DUF4388 domain-containing protein [Terriglobia bacterium]
MPLTDVLQWLGTTRKTGTLFIERNKVVKQIVFREGRVAACSSEDPPELLGHYLVGQGKITEEVLRQALARQSETREHLGKILLDMQALSTEDLRRHLAAKAEETIYSLFDWDEAEFRFDEGGEPSPHVFPVQLEIEDILLRGLKRFDEMKRIRTVFNDPGIVLRKTDRQPPAEVFKNRTAKGIHELITGDRTVAEILLHAHASEFLVTKFLFELFRNGMVEIAEVRQVSPDFTQGAASRPEEAPVDCVAQAVAQRTEVENETARSAVPEAGPPRVSPGTELEAARALMARGEFEGALDILNELYRARPSDESLRRLVAEAEAAFVDKAYRHYVPPNKVPLLRCPAESLTGEELSPVEFFLLSRFNGTWDVRSIIQITPIREVDALRTLKRMREKGYVELRDPK